ncbi:hypothetical protein L6452_19339 [Arctium lappa]|uniref:Uncharacterized protein n=1 Tax=Arctium lappa TaxID=4217 RepID=A0ACB9B8V2_ARCLA|nr:hypothetical protein L6452_19339 [Arctium lappa]
MNPVVVICYRNTDSPLLTVESFCCIVYIKLFKILKINICLWDAVLHVLMSDIIVDSVFVKIRFLIDEFELFLDLDDYLLAWDLFQN